MGSEGHVGAIATGSARVAVVLPVELREDALHRDLIPIAYGLQELGHEVTVYARSASADTPGLRMCVAGRDLESAWFWAEEAPDWALVLTWLGRAEVLEALKAAGAVVISKGDTDGLVCARHHPWPNWQRMVLHKRGPVARARAAWHFAKRIGPLHARELDGFARSLAAADALVVESSAAKRAIERTLVIGRHRRADARIVVRWNPVQAGFSRVPLERRKERVIVAVGRWDDPQKDVGLLRDVFEDVLRLDPDVRIEVVGQRSELFQGLDPSRVTDLGTVPNDQLPEVFARAQLIAFASRWEGLPIAALEALACGCSVVGTVIPAFSEIEASGGGRAARRRRGDLARAIRAELGLWDTGQRCATTLAELWRPRVERTCVAAGYCALFAELSADAAPPRA